MNCEPKWEVNKYRTKREAREKESVWVNVASRRSYSRNLMNVFLFWEFRSSNVLVEIDFNFMSSIGGVNDACPIHQGFLQALFAFQNACNTGHYRPYKTSNQKYRQCSCILHRILIQVTEKKIYILHFFS